MQNRRVDSDSDSDEEILLKSGAVPTPAATEAQEAEFEEEEAKAEEEEDESDESDSDSDSDEPLVRRTQAPATKKKAKKAPSRSRSVSSSTSASSAAGSSDIGPGKSWDPEKFQFREPAPLEPDKDAPKWWERPLSELKSDNKWTTLLHNGILFAEPYEPHGVQLLYDGEAVELTPEQEEMATEYAKILLSERNGGTAEYSQNAVFRRNMFQDWRARLGASHTIQSLEKCDFTPMVEHLAAASEERKLRNKDPEVRQQRKRDKEAIDAVFKIAIVDGVQEKVGNFRTEPPGWFRGRGKHPKAGRWKRRIMPEDVVLNISKGASIPKCPLPGHQWGGVLHNPKVTYIARWKDNITGTKFVYLDASSRFKGQSDLLKYEKARELKKHIGKIRSDYTSKLSSKLRAERQVATAVWIVDRLAIRVGGEKNAEEEADTVGVCSFRAEHVTLNKKTMEITLDFLGKDSMRYTNTVKLPKPVFLNMLLFTRGKAPSDKVFDRISVEKVNRYLNGHMDGLSAKVFRTYNASITLQDELREPTWTKDGHPGQVNEDTVVAEKRHFYDRCNREVAILCNHQRTVPKNFDEQVDKFNKRVAEAEQWLEMLEIELLEAEAGESKPRATRLTKKGEKATRKARPEASIRKEITKQQARIVKLKKDRQLKVDNREIALGTSKINYMDPRITVAWCKRVEMPIERVFQSALIRKFPWAMHVPSDFVW